MQGISDDDWAGSAFPLSFSTLGTRPSTWALSCHDAGYETSGRQMRNERSAMRTAGTARLAVGIVAGEGE